MIRRRRRRRWRIRVLPVAHDHVERWQPTAPPASWRQLAAANIAATQRILRMRHVAMLPSCHVAKLLSVPQLMLPAVCVFIHKNRHSTSVCVCVCELLQHCWGTSESSRLPLFISKCSAIKFYSRKCTLKPSDPLCSLLIFMRANEFNVYCEFFHSFSFPVFFHFCFVCKFPDTHFIIGTYWWQQLAKVFCCVRVFFCSVSIFNNTFSLEMLGKVFSGFLWKSRWSLAKSSWALESNWRCFSTHFYCNFTSLHIFFFFAIVYFCLLLWFRFGFFGLSTRNATR